MENRKAYFDSKCVEVFKLPLSAHDRQMVNIEDQSRASTGLSELSMSNISVFLLKHYAEQDIYQQQTTTKKDKRTPSTVGSLDTVKQMK